MGGRASWRVSVAGRGTVAARGHVTSPRSSHRGRVAIRDLGRRKASHTRVSGNALAGGRQVTAVAKASRHNVGRGQPSEPTRGTGGRIGGARGAVLHREVDRMLSAACQDGRALSIGYWHSRGHASRTSRGYGPGRVADIAGGVTRANQSTWDHRARVRRGGKTAGHSRMTHGVTVTMAQRRLTYLL